MSTFDHRLFNLFEEKAAKSEGYAIAYALLCLAEEVSSVRASINHTSKSTTEVALAITDVAKVLEIR